MIILICLSFEIEILNSDYQRQYEENLKVVEKFKEDSKKVKLIYYK